MNRPGFETLQAMSTNLPYLLAVWNEVLVSENVVAICKTFPAGPYPHQPAHTSQANGLDVKKASAPVKVDVVSDKGARWTRINT